MIRIKPSAWPSAAGPIARSHRARHAAAWALRAASAALDRLARQIAAAPQRAARHDEPKIEFHADAGAPEGALYVDGKLVGWLEGVSRL